MLNFKDEQTPLWFGAVLFGLIGLVQLFRFFAHWSVMIGNHEVPIYASGIMAVIALGMAYWLGSTARGKKGKLHNQ